MGDIGRKPGDRIYWEYFDGSGIGSAVIKRVEPETYIDYDKVGNPIETPFMMYITDISFNGTSKTSIEDYSCLAKSNPKRKEYDKRVNAHIKKYYKDIYTKVLGHDKKPTKTEKDLIAKTVKYMMESNLQKELEDLFNYGN